MFTTLVISVAILITVDNECFIKYYKNVYVINTYYGLVAHTGLQYKTQCTKWQ